MINVVPGILLGVKALFLVGLGLYTGFSLVLIRQEQLMADVLEEVFEPILRVLVIAHAVAAVALLVFAFILL